MFVVRYMGHLRDARKRPGADARRAVAAAGKRTQSERELALHQTGFGQALEGGRVDAAVLARHIAGIGAQSQRHLFLSRFGRHQAGRDKLGSIDGGYPVNCTFECEREDDGRWLAEVLELPGALAYGSPADEAMVKAEVPALRVPAARIEHGETGPIEINFSLPAIA